MEVRVSARAEIRSRAQRWFLSFHDTGSLSPLAEICIRKPGNATKRGRRSGSDFMLLLNEISGEYCQRCRETTENCVFKQGSARFTSSLRCREQQNRFGADRHAESYQPCVNFAYERRNAEHGLPSVNPALYTAEIAAEKNRFGLLPKIAF